MTCVSGLTLLAQESLQVSRIASSPSWVEGYQEPQSRTSLQILGIVQPTIQSGVIRYLSKRTLEERRGNRTTDGLVIHSVEGWQLGDLITRNGNTYEVVQVDDWTPYLCFLVLNYRIIALKVETY